jgi:hypothetical protein
VVAEKMTPQSAISIQHSARQPEAGAFYRRGRKEIAEIAVIARHHRDRKGRNLPPMTLIGRGIGDRVKGNRLPLGQAVIG